MLFVLGSFCYAVFVSFIVLQSSRREERASCFTFIVFLMLCGYCCSLLLPLGTVGWPAVRDCGIFWPYSKTCLKRPLKKKTKNGFQDRLSVNAGQKYCRMLQGEHSAILPTLIKLPFFINIFTKKKPVFEWPFSTGFTVLTFCKCLIRYQPER